MTVTGKIRILSVSYDEALLETRHMLLEGAGYEVVSALGLQASVELCKRGGFDIFILGHSIAHSEKLELVETFHSLCRAVR